MYRSLETESASKLTTLQREMAEKVDETRRITENKYVDMIDSYNETKRKTLELASVGSNLKRELKKVKAEMKAMACVIQPTVAEIQKAVS